MAKMTPSERELDEWAELAGRQRCLVCHTTIIDGYDICRAHWDEWRDVRPRQYQLVEWAIRKRITLLVKLFTV